MIQRDVRMPLLWWPVALVYDVEGIPARYVVPLTSPRAARPGFQGTSMSESQFLPEVQL